MCCQVLSLSEYYYYTVIVHHNFVYGSYFMLINECFDEAKNKIEILWKNVTIQCSGTHSFSLTHTFHTESKRICLIILLYFDYSHLFEACVCVCERERESEWDDCCCFLRIITVFSHQSCFECHLLSWSTLDTNTFNWLLQKKFFLFLSVPMY